MNQEIKAKWLERLRSNPDQYGRYSLHRNGKFCAMGALVDILYPNEWQQTPIGSEVFKGYACSVDSKDIEEADLTDGQIATVMRLNDGCDSYAKAINYIEGL